MNRECSTNGAKRNVYSILVRKPEEKRPLERPRRIWMDNIERDLRETEWDSTDWINLAQNKDQWMALANTLITLPAP
jgi:hypothetical protein